MSYKILFTEKKTFHRFKMSDKILENIKLNSDKLLETAT